MFFYITTDLDPMVSDALKKWSEKSGHRDHDRVRDRDHHKTKHKTKYQKDLKYREEVENRKKARGTFQYFFLIHIYLGPNCLLHSRQVSVKTSNGGFAFSRCLIGTFP